MPMTKSFQDLITASETAIDKPIKKQGDKKMTNPEKKVNQKIAIVVRDAKGKEISETVELTLEQFQEQHTEIAVIIADGSETWQVRTFQRDTSYTTFTLIESRDCPECTGEMSRGAGVSEWKCPTCGTRLLPAKS